MSEQASAMTVEFPNGRVVAAWLVVAVVCIGQFMVVLDVSIVNLALPSIQNELHFGASGLQWVINAYTLTFAGFLLLGGRAADLYGRRRVFMTGLTVFTLGSLLCATAQNEAWLIGARALQGFGGAILAPASLTVLTSTFTEGTARARALGIWSAVAAAGATTGALVGGILIELSGWRWIFFVNVPVGVLALVAAQRYVPESRADAAHRSLDLAGAITVTAGLTALVYAVVRTETYAWLSIQVLVPLVCAVILLATFVFLQARVSKAPLVPLRIFRSRSVAGANVIMFLLFASLFASGYFGSLYAQRVLGYSPLLTGVAFIPQALFIAVVAQVSARLVPRFGPRPLIAIGTVLAGTGLIWLSGITPSSTYFADLFVPFVLMGVGMGLAMMPVAVAGTAGVNPQEAGLASGLLNTSRTVGASIGLAALTTIAATRTTDALGGSPAIGAHGAAALTDGFALALGISGGLLMVTAVVALVTIPSRRELRDPEPVAEPALALEEA